MKKLALLLLALIVLILAAIYYLIPGTLVVVEIAKANVVSDAAFRSLSNQQSWAKWWPGAAAANEETDKAFVAGGNQYILSKKINNNFEILIETEKSSIASEMNLLSIPHDSTLINWHFTIQAGNNPFTRVAAYSKAVAIKKQMNLILSHAQAYFAEFKNVYGFELHEASIKDTLLITTKKFFPIYPTTDDVYTLVNKLSNFCNQQGCGITGTPMLNVTTLIPLGYQVMVALPVNRTVPQKDSISFTKMVPGKFIITDVTGGQQAVQQMHQQIKYYFQDHRRTAMAIPFEYLITDRQKETDTSKWVTRIYSPVY